MKSKHSIILFIMGLFASFFTGCNSTDVLQVETSEQREILPESIAETVAGLGNAKSRNESSSLSLAKTTSASWVELVGGNAIDVAVGYYYFYKVGTDKKVYFWNGSWIRRYGATGSKIGASGRYLSQRLITGDGTKAKCSNNTGYSWYSCNPPNGEYVRDVALKGDASDNFLLLTNKAAYEWVSNKWVKRANTGSLRIGSFGGPIHVVSGSKRIYERHNNRWTRYDPLHNYTNTSWNVSDICYSDGSLGAMHIGSGYIYKQIQPNSWSFTWDRVSGAHSATNLDCDADGSGTWVLHTNSAGRTFYAVL